MVKVRVKTVWQGKVGINEKYVDEALSANEALHIKVKEEVMVIEFDQIKDKLLSKSKEVFTDRFGKTPPYRLCYFDWKPNNGQPQLI